MDDHRPAVHRLPQRYASSSLRTPPGREAEADRCRAMQKCGARRRGYSRGKQPSVTHELRRPHRRSRATSRGGCSPALTRRTGHVARCPPKRHCGDGPIGSADRPSWSRATTTFCRQRGRHFRLRALMRSARPQVRRCSVRPSPAVLAAPNGSPRLPHVAGSISLVRPRRGIWSEWAIQDSNLGPLPYQRTPRPKQAVASGRKRQQKPCKLGWVGDAGRNRPKPGGVILVDAEWTCCAGSGWAPSGAMPHAA